MHLLYIPVIIILVEMLYEVVGCNVNPMHIQYLLLGPEEEIVTNKDDTCQCKGVQESPLHLNMKREGDVPERMALYDALLG